MDIITGTVISDKNTGQVNNPECFHVQNGEAGILVTILQVNIVLISELRLKITVSGT